MNNLAFHYKKIEATQAEVFEDFVKKYTTETEIYLPLYVDEFIENKDKFYNYLVVAHDAKTSEITALLHISFEAKESIEKDSIEKNILSTDIDFIKLIVMNTAPLAEDEILAFQQAYDNLLGAMHTPIAKLVNTENIENTYLVISKIVIPNSKPFAQFLISKTNDKS